MTSTRDFLLPDLGEGLTESELIEWHVVVGDLVELNQPLAEVETAKAIVQLPSPFAGTIAQLYVDAGTTVAVGTPIVGFALEDDAAPDDGVVPQRTSVLVGYGPRVDSGGRPQRRVRGRVSGASAATSDEPETSGASRAIAQTPRSTPPVRRFAADHDIGLSGITGTGENGMITRGDVEAALAQRGTRATAGPAGIDTSADGDVRIPIRGVRKYTADAMVRSAFTAPHVTEFLTIDVTSTTELLARLREGGEFAGLRLTMLAAVAKALCIAVRRNPTLNSRWDESAGEIIQFGRVNLGLAVATPRGLVVPNIPNAGSLTLAELAGAIGDLVGTARAGATTPAALGGGTISITNVGVFGVDAGTPILNPGEAAILAMGAVRRLPWNHHDEIALRDVMTLSLSFDHRVVDGEQASRFLTDIGSILSDPARVLAMA